MEDELKRGEALFGEGKIEEAEKCFLGILEKDSEDVEALNNLGVIHYTRGDIHVAEDFFLKALEVKDDYLDSLLNLVKLYEDEKRWEDAAIRLKRFVSIDDHGYHAFNQLGVIYLEMDDIVNAVRVLERSLELNPQQKTVRNSLNVLRIQKPIELVSRDSIGEDCIHHEVSNEMQRAKKMTKKATSLGIISRSRRPTVSVGLPVYNGADFLSQAIESILSQDFENIELVISDNCSTDNTEEICLKYRRIDERIRYHRSEENLGLIKNFQNVLGLSSAPYFMYATHDDLRERSFIGKCLEKIETDPSIALVYPRTKVLDANSRVIGIANDHLKTDQDNPIERFRHLIWEIGMCNMVYGLYRTSMLKKVRTCNETLFGDNLILAEIALFLGKIVQIDDVLFVRRLSRDYNYRSHDERYERLVSEFGSRWFPEGITLPHCRLTYAHLELVNYLEIENSGKDFLMNDVLKCFKSRFGDKMKYEISRAIELINNGYFYCTWNKNQSINWHSSNLKTNEYFHINNLLKNLQEASFIYPELPEIKNAYKTCLEKMCDHQVENFGKMAFK